MKARRLISVILSLAIVVSLINYDFIKAYAEQFSSEEVKNNSDDSAKFSVYIPSKIKVTMKADGSIITNPAHPIIYNNVADYPVCITGINITANQGWQLVNSNTELTTGNKQISLTINGIQASESGKVDINKDTWKIPGNSTLPLDINIQIPEQTTKQDIQNIISLDITVGWYDETIIPGHKYTITLENVDNATIDGIESTLYTEGQHKVPTLPTVTADEGYKFIGWVDADGNNITQGQVITSDITIHPMINKIQVEGGLKLSVTEAEDLGFKFKSFMDGLEIIEFENKLFKNTIDIPEQIGDFKVLKLGDQLFKDQTNLIRINVPDSVEYMGQGTFENCSSASIYFENLYRKDYSDTGNNYKLFSRVKEVHIPFLFKSYFPDDPEFEDWGLECPADTLIEFLYYGGKLYVDNKLITYKRDYFKVTYTSGEKYGFEVDDVGFKGKLFCVALSRTGIIDLSKYSASTDNSNGIYYCTYNGHTGEDYRPQIMSIDVWAGRRTQMEGWYIN